MTNDIQQLYTRLIDRRFDIQLANSSQNELSTDTDFYMDLLCAFHKPEDFDAQKFFRHPLDLIIKYLKHTHQFYITKNLPEIELAISLIAEHRPDLRWLQATMSTYYLQLHDHLKKHLEDEEINLFPYIEALIKAERSRKLSYDLPRKIKLMDFLLDHSHDIENDLKDLVAKLKTMEEQYQDSFAFRMLVTRLSVFELDLRIHARIEDEVLMPMAFELENKVLKAPDISIQNS
ncbi:MAG: hypothetical protein AAFX87_15785 [Bacteroidota bacterium]